LVERTVFWGRAWEATKLPVIGSLYHAVGLSLSTLTYPPYTRSVRTVMWEGASAMRLPIPIGSFEGFKGFGVGKIFRATGSFLVADQVVQRRDMYFEAFNFSFD